MTAPGLCTVWYSACSSRPEYASFVAELFQFRAPPKDRLPALQLKTRPEPDCVNSIRRSLLAGQGPMCFLCLAGETSLSITEVTSCLERPALSGFVFQTGTCSRCLGERVWTADYREIPGAGILT